MKKLIFMITVSFCLTTVKAQTQLPNGKVQLLTQVVNGDTIPFVYLRGVEIVCNVTPEIRERQLAYLRLKKDVLKVYPYAKMASEKLKYINSQIATISSEKDQKKFIKNTEKEIKDKFEQDLKKLSQNQGRILIKLIDRETGNTSYALVKDLRGNLQAFFWQGLARLFGSNLKSEYDPQNEDRTIEFIVQQIESGVIS